MRRRAIGFVSALGKNNFVENILSGEKMFLRRVGGSYVLDVDFVSEKDGFFAGLV